ncbi:MAG TPA: FxsA family protein [Acidimicrobiales bacterium]|nr:FxsA family protein [Acidimicrobiales bacterium]
MFFIGVLLAVGVEIATFALVAGHVGFLSALGLVLVVSALGPLVVRRVGLGVLAHAQERLARGELANRELLDGVVVLLAGVLICVPGFVGDALGLLLMIGPVRHLVIRAAGHRLSRRVQTMGAGRRRVIEARATPSQPAAPPTSRVPGPPLGPGASH